ncbi:hypothetical protein [Actinophytocola sp.]|nr:hypothetical protein [Actinophytocola sp.]
MHAQPGDWLIIEQAELDVDGARQSTRADEVQREIAAHRGRR